jgi:UTP:GlnB (protein PII) uridylyltransferase
MAAVEGVVVSDAVEAPRDGPEDERAWHLLTVTCDDRTGLLADLSEHIRYCGVDIVSASVATDTDSGLIVDSFAVSAWALALQGAARLC